MKIAKQNFGTCLISSIIIHMIRLVIFREKPRGWGGGVKVSSTVFSLKLFCVNYK